MELSELAPNSSQMSSTSMTITCMKTMMRGKYGRGKPPTVLGKPLTEVTPQLLATGQLQRVKPPGSPKTGKMPIIMTRVESTCCHLGCKKCANSELAGRNNPRTGVAGFRTTGLRNRHQACVGQTKRTRALGLPKEADRSQVPQMCHSDL